MIVKKNLIYMSDFGTWLKSHRKALKMSQRDLAKAANDICTDAFISQVENNKYVGKKGEPMRPSREIVTALANALNADVNEALRLAGFASEINIPDDIILESYDGFSQDDIDKIVSYIRFVREEKKKDL